MCDVHVWDEGLNLNIIFRNASLGARVSCHPVSSMFFLAEGRTGSYCCQDGSSCEDDLVLSVTELSQGACSSAAVCPDCTLLTCHCSQSQKVYS